MTYRLPQIKLAIVDDHRLFRKGIINLINSANNGRFLVLFEAGDGNDFISKIDKKALPDIVIMDVEMPNMSGFDTVVWLRDHYPDIKVLIVSMIEKEEAIVRMLKLGVKGYLSKDIEPEDLHCALNEIIKKGYYYTDFVTGKLIHSLKNEDKPHATGTHRELGMWEKLNEREREFIRHACSEMTYQEIADKMFLSPKTIDGYREAVFQKLQVKNRVGLVIKVVKNGLVQL